MMPEPRFACYADWQTRRRALPAITMTKTRARPRWRSHVGSAGRLGALVLTAVCAIATPLACGSTSAPSPFTSAATGVGGAGGGPVLVGGGGARPSDAGPDADPTLGGPCVDDGQCDDGVACTVDRCDLDLSRCRFTPDDSQCQNASYCDGLERCDGKLGCRAGEPVSCSDDKTCTIDTCDEGTQTCTHALRDADGDGDPDVHCPPSGHDCDDADPSVSSKIGEVCGNGKDDDCDGLIDEPGCASPMHDSCLDPLEITASGTYAMSTVAAAFDYASACAPAGPPGPIDAVAAIELPAGPPVDVEVTARVSVGDVGVTLATQCGDPGSILTCGAGFFSTKGGKLAKLRGRALGDPNKPVALPLYVSTSYGTAVTLDVQMLPPEPAPTNETCGTALSLTPGQPVVADVLGAAHDLGSMCPAATGELVYRFTLDDAANVDLYATSLDGDGYPVLSLRAAGCALPEDEITCSTSLAGHLFWQALPPGDYYVAVAATAPTALSLDLELSAPTTPAPDETCDGAPALQPNKTIAVPLSTHQDDLSLGCLPGAVDAAHSLMLAEPSDVLLVQRTALYDFGAVELAAPACGGADLLACGNGAQSPVRTAKHGVPAGEYRVVAESQQAEDVQLTAFVRPAVAPTFVPFADACADALVIPKTGGFFQGNTANVAADYAAGCDYGGVSGPGAPEQLLKLELDAPKRVVLDMAGSTYTTLLDVRKGPSCPGTEMPKACAVGYGANKSYLDLSLDAGTYYLQVDGFSMESGAWFLDVRVVDP
jgi:hypothetical protein